MVFINSFKNDLKMQLIEMIKRSSNDYSEIRIDQRFFAYVLFGINKKNWFEVFGGDTKVTWKLNFDKTAAVRGLIWSCAAGFFLVLSIFIK
jgi:hypothetical protein